MNYDMANIYVALWYSWSIESGECFMGISVAYVIVKMYKKSMPMKVECTAFTME